jgi:hypothetical protein
MRGLADWTSKLAKKLRLQAANESQNEVILLLKMQKHLIKQIFWETFNIISTVQVIR